MTFLIVLAGYVADTVYQKRKELSARYYTLSKHIDEQMRNVEDDIQQLKLIKEYAYGYVTAQMPSEKLVLLQKKRANRLENLRSLSKRLKQVIKNIEYSRWTKSFSTLNALLNEVKLMKETLDDFIGLYETFLCLNDHILSFKYDKKMEIGTQLLYIFFNKLVCKQISEIENPIEIPLDIIGDFDVLLYNTCHAIFSELKRVPQKRDAFKNLPPEISNIIKSTEEVFFKTWSNNKEIQLKETIKKHYDLAEKEETRQKSVTAIEEQISRNFKLIMLDNNFISIVEKNVARIISTLNPGDNFNNEDENNSEKTLDLEYLKRMTEKLLDSVKEKRESKVFAGVRLFGDSNRIKNRTCEKANSHSDERRFFMRSWKEMQSDFFRYLGTYYYTLGRKLTVAKAKFYCDQYDKIGKNKAKPIQLTNKVGEIIKTIEQIYSKADDKAPWRYGLYCYAKAWHLIRTNTGSAKTWLDKAAKSDEAQGNKIFKNEITSLEEQITENNTNNEPDNKTTDDTNKVGFYHNSRILFFGMAHTSAYAELIRKEIEDETLKSIEKNSVM